MDVTIAGDTILRPLNDDQMGRLTISLAAFDGEIGTGAVPIDDPDADDDYRGGRQLRLDEGTTLLIDGFIADQDRIRGPVPVVNREVVYGLQDPNALLFAKRAVRSRPSELDRARVLAFAAADLPGVLTTMVLNTNTTTMPAKRYDGEGWSELITDTVELTGKTLFIHDTAAGDRCLHYHRLTEGHTCGLTISDVATQSATVYNPWGPAKRTTPADLGNDIRFVDQANRTATYTDATSITNHDADGLAHEKIIRVEAMSQSHLAAIAASQGPETKDERFTWMCTIGPLDEAALALIRVGDLMTVTSQVMGLTAAVKRIAHMNLRLAKDKNGRAITGWWMAELELGAPIRRPFGKGKSKPKAAAAAPPIDPANLVGLNLGTEHWADREYKTLVGHRYAPSSPFTDSDNPLIAQPTAVRGWSSTGPPSVGSSRGGTFVRHVAPAGASWARLRASVYSAGDIVDTTTVAVALASGASFWDTGTPPQMDQVGSIVWQRVLPTDISPAVTGPFPFECIIPIVNGQCQFAFIDVGDVSDPTPPDRSWISYMFAQGEAYGGPLKYELTYYGVSTVGVGDWVQPVPIAIGDGIETQFTTPYPYTPGSLVVYDEDGFQIATETDPATGQFTMAYVPVTGALVSAAFVVASTGQTGIPLDPPGRELGTTAGEVPNQWKEPVRLTTTGAINIIVDLNAGDTLDGLTLVDGDRVLVKDQAAPAQNGIYVVSPSPVRATDMDDDDEVLGAVVYVIEGTDAGKSYRNTNTAAVTVGTDALTFAEFGTTVTDIENAGRWEVVMAPGVTFPPDPVQTVDGSDWVYAWVSG